MQINTNNAVMYTKSVFYHTNFNVIWRKPLAILKGTSYNNIKPQGLPKTETWRSRKTGTEQINRLKTQVQTISEAKVEILQRIGSIETKVEIVASQSRVETEPKG